ncbi:uncharacterized protein METZ01_LOCUS431655, partial [marine metagenome]
LKKLRSILRYIGSCDGNMEEGSLRCDANVSVRRPGQSFGTRCEIKNLNSIRFLVRAIEFEAARQIEILEDDGLVRQETRLFDPNRDETRSMRSKEDAHDYRYFPDPDLLPLHLDVEWVAELKDGLPELPDKKMARFLEEYGLSVENANVLVSERDRADFFESVAKGRDPKQAANWVVGDLLGKLNKTGTELVDAKISPSELGHLIDLVNKDAISGRMAKRVFEEMFETGKRADDVVIEQGLTQVSDEGALVGHIREVLDGNVDKV